VVSTLPVPYKSADGKVEYTFGSFHPT